MYCFTSSEHVCNKYMSILQNGQEYRNGLVYRLSVLYSDGTQKEEDLYIRLIDASTKLVNNYIDTHNQILYYYTHLKQLIKELDKILNVVDIL